MPISASPFKARRKALEPLSPKEGPKAPKLAESPYKPVEEPRTPPAEPLPEPAPIHSQVPTPQVAEKPPSATGPRDHSEPVSHQDKLTHTPEELEKKAEPKQEKQPEQPQTVVGHPAPASVEEAHQLARSATEENFSQVADQLSLLPFDSLVELEYHLHGADPATPTGRLLGVVRAMLDNVDDNQQLTQASYDAAARVLRGEKSLGSKAFEPLEFPVIEKKGEVEGDSKPVSLKVRRVNAFELRNRDKDWQEFVNIGTHLEWSEIPKDEVWVADTVSEEELPILVRGAEAEVWASHHGRDENDAYEYGLAVDRSERNRSPEMGGNRPFHNEVPPDIYIRLWKEVPGRTEPIKVFIVDGVKVRNMNKTDFGLGGHAYIYPFIPEDEIWIADQAEEEIPFNLLHEFTERDLMRNERANYDDAHSTADNAELAARDKWKKDGTVPEVGYAGDGSKDYSEVERPNEKPKHPHTENPNESLLYRKKGNLFGAEDDKHTYAAKDPPPTPLQEHDTQLVDDQYKSLEQPHKYGCVMAAFPEDFRKEVTDWVLENVPECHLGPGGREHEIHVTVKYGLKDSSPETVAALKGLLARFGPFKVKLGGLSIFGEGYGKWNNEDGDVLKIDVEGAKLRELNALISSTFPCYDKYPFRPHITLAYINPQYSHLYAPLDKE